MPLWFYEDATLTLSYVGHAESAGTASSYTFTYTFSTANANRHLIAGVAFQSASSLTVAVSIGGVSATPIGTKIGTTGNAEMAFFYAVVPTNTTQTVVVTFSGGNAVQCGCGLYDLEGVTVLNDSMTTSTGLLTATLNVPAGGAVLGIDFASGSSQSHSWTGITLDYTANVFSANWQYSGAHGNFATGNSSLTVTDTVGGTISSRAGAIILFSP